MAAAISPPVQDSAVTSESFSPFNRFDISDAACATSLLMLRSMAGAR
jgi:hypothetical protein